MYIFGPISLKTDPLFKWLFDSFLELSPKTPHLSVQKHTFVFFFSSAYWQAMTNSVHPSIWDRLENQEELQTFHSEDATHPTDDEPSINLDNALVEADDAKLPETPLPWKKVMPIFIMLFCEAFNSSAIFSFVGFMIRDFHLVPESDPKFRTYAGWLASCFFIAQLLSRYEIGLKALLRSQFCLGNTFRQIWTPPHSPVWCHWLLPVFSCIWIQL